MRRLSPILQLGSRAALEVQAALAPAMHQAPAPRQEALDVAAPPAARPLVLRGAQPKRYSGGQALETL